MLSGDNGILQKATDAKTFTSRASVVEQARTDVLGYQAENKGTDLQKSQLQTVLEKYFKEVPDLANMSDTEILNKELETLTEYGTHNITVKEIFDGNFANSNVAPTYEIGTPITFGGENFYIIGSNATSVTLLSKYCIKADGSKQDTNAGIYNGNERKTAEAIVFASNRGINDYNNLQNVQGNIKYIVEQYKSNIARNAEINENEITARLMLYSEASSLESAHSDILYSNGEENSDLKLNYWLGSPYESDSINVWNVYGIVGILYREACDYLDMFAVRPVIIVSKSNI